MKQSPSRLDSQEKATTAFRDEDTVEGNDHDGFTGIYGAVVLPETPEFLSQCLEQLDEELKEVPSELKTTWNRAQEECPALVGEDHKLLFLRADAYDAELATLRLLRYWDTRVKIMGEEHAFAPITVPSMQKGMQQHVNHIFFLPGLDGEGRRVVYARTQLVTPRKERNSTFRRDALFGLWCTLHLLLMGAHSHDSGSEEPKEMKKAQQEQTTNEQELYDTSVQRLGYVILSDVRGYDFWAQFDRAFVREYFDLLYGCFPLKITGYHIVVAKWSAYAFIMWLYCQVMGPLRRCQLAIHAMRDVSATDSKYTPDPSLFETNYGIPKEMLPVAVGGCYQVPGWKYP